MAADECGFYKPKVDKDKCISCGICVRECTMEQGETLKLAQGRVYGAKNADKAIRQKSSSGGVFSAFADYILNNNGAVYGVVCERSEVKHIRVTDSAQLPPIRGSKYVQSKLSPNLYEHIANDLLSGKAVLFSGTPCQCAAIRSYVKKQNLPDSRLLVVDFICHGAASQLVFSDYIAYCEQKAGKQILTHIFRSKDKDWGSHYEKNVFADGTENGKGAVVQMNVNIFRSSYTLCKACFRCQFADIKRVSDITMGDFWGIEKSHPDRFDKTGVSVLLVNTPKGAAFSEKLSDLILFDAKLQDLKQWNIYHPTKEPKSVEEFWKMYHKRGFLPTIKHFCGLRWYRRLIRFISKPIPLKWKRNIKRYLKKFKQ